MAVEKHIKIVNKVAQNFDAVCTICNGEKQADASSVLGLMMLESHQGQEVKVICDGPDADDALHAIESLIVERFNEQE